MLKQIRNFRHNDVSFVRTQDWHPKSYRDQIILKSSGIQDFDSHLDEVFSFRGITMSIFDCWYKTVGYLTSIN